MDYKINTKRQDKCDAKKARINGPYSSKHIRHVEKVAEIRAIRNAIPKNDVANKKCNTKK
jgi:hypothetical protein